MIIGKQYLNTLWTKIILTIRKNVFINVNCNI